MILIEDESKNQSNAYLSVFFFKKQKREDYPLF